MSDDLLTFEFLCSEGTYCVTITCRFLIYRVCVSTVFSVV